MPNPQATGKTTVCRVAFRLLFAQTETRNSGREYQENWFWCRSHNQAARFSPLKYPQARATAELVCVAATAKATSNSKRVHWFMTVLRRFDGRRNVSDCRAHGLNKRLHSRRNNAPRASNCYLRIYERVSKLENPISVVGYRFVCSQFTCFSFSTCFLNSFSSRLSFRAVATIISSPKFSKQSAI